MNMEVAKNMVVTLDYSVADPDGEIVDAGQEPLVYLHGGYDDIFPMIEEALHKHPAVAVSRSSALFSWLVQWVGAEPPSKRTPARLRPEPMSRPV